MCVLSCLVIDMPYLYNIGGAVFLVFMCHAVQSTLRDSTHLGGARLHFRTVGFCAFPISFLFVQIPYCHQSTKKGEIVRAYLSLSVLVIDDNAFAD